MLVPSSRNSSLLQRKKTSHWRLLIPVQNPAPCKIIGRQLALYVISRQNLNEVHADLPADLGQDLMSAFKCNPKHGIGKSLCDGAFHLKSLLLCISLRFFCVARITRLMLLSWSSSHRLERYFPSDGGSVNMSGPVSVMATVCSK